MPDIRQPDGFEPQDASIEAVRHADSFIDALADGHQAAPQDAAEVELAALLGGWRDELRWPPATGLIAESDAVAALNAGLAERRPSAGRERWADTQKRGNRRGLSIVGTAAAAALCLGGFGAVVAGSGPGDGLYGIRTMLFGAQKQVRDAQIGLAAQTELNQVENLIAQGDWDQAQNKLVAVSTQVAAVDDELQKQQLLDQFNDLSAKVVERDPQATAPPGVVYTVPPSAVALVPAAGPTATPAAPAPTTTALPQPTTVSTPESVVSASTPASASATSIPPATTAPPSAVSPSTSVAPPSEASPSPGSASAVPSSASQAQTPDTTAASDSAAQTSAPVSTTADAREAVTTTAAAPTADSAAPTADSAASQPTPAPVITTTPVLVPAG